MKFVFLPLHDVTMGFPEEMDPKIHNMHVHAF